MQKIKNYLELIVFVIFVVAILAAIWTPLNFYFPYRVIGTIIVLYSSYALFNIASK